MDNQKLILDHTTKILHTAESLQMDGKETQDEVMQIKSLIQDLMTKPGAKTAALADILLELLTKVATLLGESRDMRKEAIKHVQQADRMMEQIQKSQDRMEFTLNQKLDQLNRIFDLSFGAASDR